LSFVHDNPLASELLLIASTVKSPGTTDHLFCPDFSCLLYVELLVHRRPHANSNYGRWNVCFHRLYHRYFAFP